MSSFVYRLQLLLEHKEEAKKHAERELRHEEQELQAQLDKLKGLQQREQELRDQRNQRRRNLLRAEVQDQSLLAREVQERSEYLVELGFQIEEAMNDVLLQRDAVREQEVRVETAKENVSRARREVEVLTKHRSRQQERFVREQQAKEELALDEIGNVLYATRRSST